MFGFYRVCTCVPELRVADPAFNTGKMLELAEKAAKTGAAAALFPELCVTGYTCADLFHNSALLDAAEQESARFISASAEFDTIFAFGAPVRNRGLLFNACVLCRRGKILGIVPKTNLPGRREFYEPRWFSSGAGMHGGTADFAGSEGIPFGTDLIFDGGGEFRLGVEICEDMWSVIPPSSRLALAGASLLLNPSASNDLVGKSAYRRELVKNQSARCVAAYVYVSAGVNESTTDLVFGGHSLAAENGRIVLDSPRFGRGSTFYTADFDLQRIAGARLSDSSFANCAAIDPQQGNYRFIPTGTPVAEIGEYSGKVEKYPFVPSNPEERDERCREIFSIQSAGLAKRIEHTHAKKLVIGISGGLDSTLALLVCENTLKLLGRPASDCIAVTMPGFGTTDRTYTNAVTLCRTLGAELREIPIAEACMKHFSDIGHDPAVRNVVYENTQARERTQILLDIANAEGGIAIGTGDLSESAMGWCTYNGDHISMYAVNCSVPKTLVRYVIAWAGDKSEPAAAEVLRDVMATPVSPELLPASKDGRIEQKTEDLIGPYSVHDFFLYHFMKYGASPEKLLYLATLAFRDEYKADRLAFWLKTFLRRFFTQQFKRSCMPDGPKVGSVCLSPRGDWRMPSDASFNAFIK